MPETNETNIVGVPEAEAGATGFLLGFITGGLMRVWNVAKMEWSRGRGKVATSLQHYTLTPADEEKTIFRTNATGGGIIIGNDTDLEWPIGGWVQIVKLGAGYLEVQIASGVTLHSGNGRIRLRAVGSLCTLKKVAANEWVMWGDTST